MAIKNTEVLNLTNELNKKGLKSKVIAEKIKEQLGIIVSDRTIRKWLQKGIDNEINKVRQLKNDINYTNPFDFEGDNIVFYYKDEVGNKKVSIDIKEIREIWEDYVIHGGNLNGQQIITKYELNPKVWNLIKNRLHLYKTSDIIPDWLLEHIETTEGIEKVEEIIEEVSHKAVFNKYNNQIVKKYNSNKEREYSKAITKLYSIENFLENLRSFIDNYEPENYINYEEINNLHKFNNIETNNNTLYTTLTDIHIGKEGTDKVIKRLNLFVKDIIERPEKDIVLFILGDLVESVIIGGKHPNVSEHMDGPYGFDLIMKTTKILENMITEIYKSGKNIKIHGIFGNHDSFDKIDNLDGTAGLTIYELVKRGIDKLGIQLNYYRNIWKTVNTNDFCFILNHGTGPHTKKKPQDILWEFGDNKKENIILQGDKHHGEMQNVSKNGTRILSPALAGKGQYDSKLGLSSMTGFTVIKKGYNNKPKVEFIFLD